MYKIKRDEVRNRLYITLTGVLSLEEAKKARHAIEIEVEFLKPNFNLINDISKFIHGDEEAGKVLQGIMIFLIQKKVEKVIRVVGTSKAGLMQFANNSLPIDSYRLKYVPTLDEAEKLLALK